MKNLKHLEFRNFLFFWRKNNRHVTEIVKELRREEKDFGGEADEVKALLRRRSRL